MLTHILRANSLYNGLSNEEILLIVNLCQRLPLPKGTVLFRENQQDDGALYIIEEGIIKILKQPESDRPRVLAMFGIGNVFGEMSFLDGRERSATALVDEDAILCKLLPAKMKELEDHAPKTAVRFMKILVCKIVARLRQTDEALVDKGEHIIVT